jgi:hypothetical protein
MMKRLLKGLWYSLLLLLLLAGSPIPNARAQSATDSISSLYVSLWPDFDRRSVLVILTGTLPADASLPADVTLPFPDNGELNAVARVDVDDRMIDDIEFSRSPGTIELTTPDPRFRVEYYFPYSVDGKQRAFDFAWSASVSVEQLNVAVQEPIGANALVMVPSAVDMVAGQHGMTNHLLESQPVPAGQTFAVQVSYEMLAPHLSVEAFSARAGPVSAHDPQHRRLHCDTRQRRSEREFLPQLRPLRATRGQLLFRLRNEVGVRVATPTSDRAWQRLSSWVAENRGNEARSVTESDT